MIKREQGLRLDHDPSPSFRYPPRSVYSFICCCTTRQHIMRKRYAKVYTTNLNLIALELTSLFFISSFILGAELNGPVDELQAAATSAGTTAEAFTSNASTCPAAGDRGDQSSPMHNWSGWWFIRTYLQSLGQVHICVIANVNCAEFYRLQVASNGRPLWPILVGCLTVKKNIECLPYIFVATQAINVYETTDSHFCDISYFLHH